MNHKEAFALMWYGCPCGHRERYWNSRDGVTPFMTACPSCGEADMQHISWELDEASPHHKPFHGQRVWIDMTEKAAVAYMLKTVEMAAKQSHIIPASHHKAMVESLYHEGKAPDLRIEGYEVKP